MKKERKNEIWGVLFLLLGLFTLASLLFFHREDISFFTSHPASPIQNRTGIIGAYLSFALALTFGISAWLIPALFLLWSVCFFMQKVPEKKFFKFLGLIVALFSMSTLISISIHPDLRFDRAGVVGYLVGSHLLQYFGYVGSFILALSCLLLSLLLATDFLIYPIVKNFFETFSDVTEGTMEKFAWIRDWLSERLEQVEDTPKAATKKNGKKAQSKETKPKILSNTPIKVKPYRPEVQAEEIEEVEAPAKMSRQALKEKLKKQEASPPVKPQGEDGKDTVEEEGADKPFEGIIGTDAKESESYVFPGLDLIKRPGKSLQSNDNLQGNSEILERTLGEFGIEVKVVEVEQGPVITRYELMPAPGVKVNSISALSDDIALALKAISVRLIVPIPGKSAIGVEVPNSVTNTVFVRELIETQNFKAKDLALPLALGKDTSGKTLIADLAKMPHLLIAGTTGSGKTVCVNSLILGLLYSCSPQDLKMIMVDPKMVELAVYNKIPHMLSPVVTDVKKAAHTLNWVVNEMEKRYKLFATVGVRNIQSFNDRPISEETAEEVEGIDSENVIPNHLPYIVVVIDELADLMLIARDKVEGAITRLAQLSRAVGIHLILATQRPSVDVITGIIKANFPARISFKVASKIDSRTVLDANGADKLIGRGDMLFIQPGDAKPIRGQAPLVVDQEINNVVEFVSKQGTPEFHPEIQDAQQGKATAGAQEKDELFEEAVNIVIETRQASTSNLQRRLRLGYTRAARIIDQMEAEGIIGPANGAKPRDILVSHDSEQPVETYE